MTMAQPMGWLIVDTKPDTPDCSSTLPVLCWIVISEETLFPGHSETSRMYVTYLKSKNCLHDSRVLPISTDHESHKFTTNRHPTAKKDSDQAVRKGAWPSTSAV